MGGGRCSARSRCQRQRLLSVVISLGLGERTGDRLLDAPPVRRIGHGVAAIEEHPRHTVRLDQRGDYRRGRLFRSMDRDDTEAVPGEHLDRCRDVINHHKGDPVGTVDHEGRLAIVHA
jgi:hypothetical protein